MSFAGKVALVTGGATGIGFAAARLFAREGARVVIAGRRAEVGAEAAEALRADGAEVLFVAADISRPEDARAMVEAAVRRFGGLDYVCNNAGVAAAPVPVAEVTEDEWDRVVDINLRGLWLCLREQLRCLSDRPGSAIVNVASINGLVAMPYGLSPYTAAKHGIIGLTRSAALEYAQKDVRVNAVCPAFIRTPMLAPVTGETPEGEAFWGRQHPLGRIGRPEEVAEAVVWLCSSRASFITGVALPVDGGWTAQ